MDYHLFISFVIATSLFILIPGQSVLLTVARSISFGWKPALFFTVTGSVCGISIQLAIAVIGLFTVINSAADFFIWLRWGGVIYLVYFGIRMFLSASSEADIKEHTDNEKSLFLQGMIITIFNPKSLIFLTAFLPQFVDTEKPLFMQFLIIIPVFLFITYAITGLWAVLAGKGRIFMHNRRVHKIFSQAAGIGLVFAGINIQ